MWKVNWLKQLHHLCGFHWRILHFRPNTEHHIFWRITTTFRTFLETSFTKCKQTRQHYVRCHPCSLQLFLFLTKNSNSQAIANFTLTYTSCCTNIPLCNNRPITIYTSYRIVCFMSDIINRVGDVTKEQCTLCILDLHHLDIWIKVDQLDDTQHNKYSLAPEDGRINVWNMLSNI